MMGCLSLSDRAVGQKKIGREENNALTALRATARGRFSVV